MCDSIYSPSKSVFIFDGTCFHPVTDGVVGAEVSMGKATKLTQSSRYAVLLDVGHYVSIREAQFIKLYLSTGGRCVIEECKGDLHIRQQTT